MNHYTIPTAAAIVTATAAIAVFQFHGLILLTAVTLTIFIVPGLLQFIIQLIGAMRIHSTLQQSTK